MSRVFNFSRSLLAAAAASSKVKASPSASFAAAAAAEPAKKVAMTGINKPIPVSPAMRKFLGVGEISRAQAMKKIWEHIKSHSLQNPANKREIKLDDKLKSIFGNKEKVGMLEIGKLITPHFVKSS